MIFIFCLPFFSCGTLAKRAGYGFFGVADFKECWAGELTSEFFDSSTKANKCWGVKPNYKECVDNAETKCVGTGHYNYIYEIISGIMKKCLLLFLLNKSGNKLLANTFLHMTNSLFNFILITFNLADVRSCTVIIFQVSIIQMLYMHIIPLSYIFSTSRVMYHTRRVFCFVSVSVVPQQLLGNSAVRYTRAFLNIINRGRLPSPSRNKSPPPVAPILSLQN